MSDQPAKPTLMQTAMLNTMIAIIKSLNIDPEWVRGEIARVVQISQTVEGRLDRIDAMQAETMNVLKANCDQLALILANQNGDGDYGERTQTAN